MERVIEALGTGLGNSVSWLAESGILFALFAIIWVAFGAAVIWSQGSLDQAWQVIRDLPLIVQIVIWVLFLPVMIGLWIWETGWPIVVRLVLVVGVACWNLLMFLPKALQVARLSQVASNGWLRLRGPPALSVGPPVRPVHGRYGSVDRKLE